MPHSNIAIGQFPNSRLRRNRQSDWSRNLIRENSVHVNDLIWPVFIRDPSLSDCVETFPGVRRVTVDQVVDHVREAVDLGIQAVMLFPVIPFENRTENGEEALNPNNLICQAIRRLKQAYPNLGIISDVALDPYTSHGHDGLFINGDVANDESVDVLCQQALTLVQAGADAVSPSDMMDGRIGALRKCLDDHGFKTVKIISYAAKYISSFYGPYRDMLGSNNALGKKGKESYQLDPANGDEALREAAQDIAEGADMLIVKPGLPYLDIVYRFKQAFKMPVVSFQISGEYAMLKAAAAQGMVNEHRVLMETLVAFKRAGADAIITYGAVDAARIIKGVPNGQSIRDKRAS